MMRLGRFIRTILNNGGVAVANASCEIRRQGATVKADQTKTTGQAINVEDIGAILAADTVEIWRGGTTLVSSGGGESAFTVDSVSITARTVTLSNYTGSLSLTDDDRISPTNNLLALYNDTEGTESKTNPLTSSSTGQVTCWMMRGNFDRKVSGSGVTSQLIEDDFVGSLDVFDTNSCRYRARGDGSTDNTDFFIRALAEAYEDGTEGNGGIITTEPGIYMVSDVVTMPGSRMIWRGAGRRATVIKAAAGFSFDGATDSIIRIGDGSANAYSRIEAMTLDCNDIANGICFYSQDIQENSGAVDCAFVRYRTKGVFVGGTFSAQNYIFRDLEFGPSASGSTAIGMDLSAAGRPVLTRITFNPWDGVTVQSGPVIHLRAGGGGVWEISNLNIEDHTTGIQISASGATGCVENVSVNNITTTFQIDAGCNGWRLFNVPGQIVDNTTGGNGTFSTNAGSTYILGNDGGAGAKFILSGDGDAASRMPSTFTFLKGVNLTTAGDLNLDSSVDLIVGKRVESHAQETVASGATISVTKNIVRLTGNTTINTINIDGSAPGASHIGYELELYSTADAVALGTSGNIVVARVIPVNCGVRLRWDNTSGKWRPVDTKPGIGFSAYETLTPDGSNDITLGAKTRFVAVNGATVRKIISAAAYAGHKIVLRRASEFTLTNGVAGTANDILTPSGGDEIAGESQSLPTVDNRCSALLESDGVNWMLLSITPKTI